MDKQEQKDAATHAQQLNDLKGVLKTSSGKNVIWNILSVCGIYENTFTGNSQSYYLDGRRSIGLEILRMTEDVDPTAYPRLLLTKQKEK